MRRRDLLRSVGAAPCLVAIGSRAADAEPWSAVRMTTEVELRDAPGAALLYVPVASDAGDWQRAAPPRIVSANGSAAFVHDARYGATTLRAAWGDDARAQTVTVEQIVSVRDREAGSDRGAPRALDDAERRFWLLPTPSLPTDGIVRQTAERIVAGRTGQREKLRAIYDWVVENTWRDASVPGCGTGDIAAMLRSDRFGGKCADINSLAVGLARAAGLPARDVYGIRVAPSRFDAVLGHAGDVSKAQHCRAEVFLDGVGWFPIDPADVRKIVLEEGLPLDHPRVRAARVRLFGSWEMNWVAYNHATDIVLPGAAGRQPAFPFLMYPCAFTSAGAPDCVDPATFRYRITATPA